MNRIVITFILLIIAVILIALFRLGYGQSLYYAYRLNVNLNSPTGMISGSALYVTSAGRGKPLVTSSGPVMWGEAVILQPKVGHPIFISVPWVETPRVAFNLNLEWEESKRGISIASKLADIADGQSANLNSKSYPNIFTFRDVDDPSSVEILFYNNGTEKVDRFSDVLGSGWGISEISVQMLSIPSWPYLFLGSDWASYWLRIHGNSDGLKIRSRIKWIDSESETRAFNESIGKIIGNFNAVNSFGRSAFYHKGW